jgi:hypothetical protein
VLQPFLLEGTFCTCVFRLLALPVSRSSYLKIEIPVILMFWNLRDFLSSAEVESSRDPFSTFSECSSTCFFSVGVLWII